MLFLTTIKEKICENVQKIYSRIKILLQGNKNTFKRVFTYFITTTIKIKMILEQVRLVLAKTNKDYDLV